MFAKIQPPTGKKKRGDKINRFPTNEKKTQKREDIAILPLHQRNTRRLVGGRGDALVVVGFVIIDF